MVQKQRVYHFTKMKKLGKGGVKMNKNSLYEIKVRRARYIVKEKEIEYDEKYCIDTNTGEEIYNRDIEIENDIIAYDEYKKKVGLLTSEEIRKIREKYNLTQKDYALSIGVGEITVHRFENGTIQTDSINSLMEFSKEPDNMYKMIIDNKEKLDEAVFNCTIERIQEARTLKMHRIANINYDELRKLPAKTESASVIAEEVIQRYNACIDQISIGGIL